MAARPRHLPAAAAPSPTPPSPLRPRPPRRRDRGVPHARDAAERGRRRRRRPAATGFPRRRPRRGGRMATGVHPWGLRPLPISAVAFTASSGVGSGDAGRAMPADAADRAALDLAAREGAVPRRTRRRGGAAPRLDQRVNQRRGRARLPGRAHVAGDVRRGARAGSEKAQVSVARGLQEEQP